MRSVGIVWPLTLAFVDIALHRRGPEDLPPSQYLLGLVLLAYLGIALAASSLRSPFMAALHLVLVDTLIYLAFTWLLLRFFERGERFEQTATALLGTGSLLTLLSIPVFAWSDSADPQPAGAMLLAFGLLVWSIDIGGHVLSRSLNQPYIVGAMIMVVYVAATVALHMSLFPPAA